MKKYNYMSRNFVDCRQLAQSGNSMAAEDDFLKLMEATPFFERKRIVMSLNELGKLIDSKNPQVRLAVLKALPMRNLPTKYLHDEHPVVRATAIAHFPWRKVFALFANQEEIDTFKSQLQVQLGLVPKGMLIMTAGDFAWQLIHGSENKYGAIIKPVNIPLTTDKRTRAIKTATLCMRDDRNFLALLFANHPYTHVSKSVATNPKTASLYYEVSKQFHAYNRNGYNTMSCFAGMLEKYQDNNNELR